MALSDLKRAYELAPNDKLISRYINSIYINFFSNFFLKISSYFQLKKELENQRKKDLSTFGGLFERGTICKKSDTQLFKSEKFDVDNMTVGDVFKKIRDMKSAAQSLYRDGKVAESNDLLERANSLQKEIEDYQASLPKNNSVDWLNVDYDNPTPEIIEVTSQMGLDLNDPR